MDPNRYNNSQSGHKAASISAADTTKLHDRFELVINWYKTNSRSLVGEEIVPNLHIQKLMSILGNPIWNQIYHCWQIELKHMADLQPYVSHTFDPSKYVYFIEAYNTSKN